MPEASTRIPPDDYISFLLRLWLIRRTNGETVPIGEILSVQSGEMWRFESVDAMFEFLRGTVNEKLST